MAHQGPPGDSRPGGACTHPLRPGTAVMVMAVAVLTSCVPALLNVSVDGDLHAFTPLPHRAGPRMSSWDRSHYCVG